VSTKPRLTPREAGTLYTFLISFVFLFYLLGLSLGSNRFLEPRTGEADLERIAERPLEDVTPTLDFYQNLVMPEQAGEEPEAVAEAATVESGSTGESEEEQPAAEPVVPGSPVYTVQVGAFTAEADARRLRLRLEAQGYDSLLSEPYSTDPYYRVWIGQFEEETQAREMEQVLRQDGFLTYIKLILEPGADR